MIARGEVTGVKIGETSKKKPFAVITILEREGGETRLIRVKDYNMQVQAEVGKHIEVNVWVSAYADKNGGAGVNIIASNAQTESPVAGVPRPASVASALGGRAA